MRQEYLTLVRNIKFYRKRKNISQEKLAELADLSSSYIKQIESARDFKNLTLYSLFKISKALDIDIIKLFEKNNTKIGV